MFVSYFCQTFTFEACRCLVTLTRDKRLTLKCLAVRVTHMILGFVLCSSWCCDALRFVKIGVVGVGVVVLSMVLFLLELLWYYQIWCSKKLKTSNYKILCLKFFNHKKMFLKKIIKPFNRTDNCIHQTLSFISISKDIKGELIMIKVNCK